MFTLGEYPKHETLKTKYVGRQVGNCVDFPKGASHKYVDQNYDWPTNSYTQGNGGPERPTNERDLFKRKAKLPRGKLTALESFLLDVANSAKAFSKHKRVFDNEESTGGSKHFHKTWRNLLGNQSGTALAGIVHSWKRWREYVL